MKEMLGYWILDDVQMRWDLIGNEQRRRYKGLSQRRKEKGYNFDMNGDAPNLNYRDRKIRSRYK